MPGSHAVPPTHSDRGETALHTPQNNTLCRTIETNCLCIETNNCDHPKQYNKKYPVFQLYYRISISGIPFAESGQTLFLTIALQSTEIPSRAGIACHSTACQQNRLSACKTRKIRLAREHANAVPVQMMKR